MLIQNQLLIGDCREVMRALPESSISACITDPPYNYEFIGHKWSAAEVEQRIDRVKDSKTLVKNIPYGSGLAGGVRNTLTAEISRKEIIENRNKGNDYKAEWVLKSA